MPLLNKIGAQRSFAQGTSRSLPHHLLWVSRFFGDQSNFRVKLEHLCWHQGVYTRMLKRLVLSLAATKSFNKVGQAYDMISLKLSIVSRPFHINPLCHSSCDFGRFCNCIECTQNAMKPICEVCKVHPAVNQSSKWSQDRKGVSSHTFTSFYISC
jgi:hypothetical protein